MESKIITCPLCGNKNHKLIESINTSTLKKLWTESNIDISNLIINLNSVNYYKCSTCFLGFFNPQILGDNQLYSQLGQEDRYYLHQGKSEFQYAKNLITSGSSVLDIGSGMGVFSKYLDSSIEYTGLELSSRAVELAKKNSVNVIKSTIEEHSQNSQLKYDFIVIFQVLEHIEDIHSFIESTKTMLKDLGKLIIAVPNNDSFIKNTPNHILNLPPHHTLHWNKKSLENLAEEYKFLVNDIFCEKVSKMHAVSFYFSNIDSFFKKIFFISPEVKISPMRTFLSKISWKIADSLVFFNFNVYKKSLGQTIIISMQKIL